MNNRWKASVTQKEETSADTHSSTHETPDTVSGIGSTSASLKNTKLSHNKIGIAMGVVGALLVIAGTVPMLMDGDSNTLQGDLTQDEEMDPLVALLSGGTPETAKASPLATPVITPTLAPTLAPSTPPVIPTLSPRNNTVTPTPSSEIDKILAEEGELKVVRNSNIGTQDRQGSIFEQGIEDTPSNFHGSASGNNTINHPTPKTTVQTGVETSSFLGFLLMIIAGGILYVSASRRKS